MHTSLRLKSIEMLDMLYLCHSFVFCFVFVNVAIWRCFFFVYVQNLVFLCSFTCLTLEFADIRVSCVFQFQFTRLLFRRSQVNCRGDFFSPAVVYSVVVVVIHKMKLTSFLHLICMNCLWMSHFFFSEYDKEFNFIVAFNTSKCIFNLFDYFFN